MEVYNLHSNLYKAMKLDGVMIQQSALPHPDRDRFYNGCNNKTIEEMVNDFIPVTRKDYAVEMVKQCLYKAGILQEIKKHK